MSNIYRNPTQRAGKSTPASVDVGSMWDRVNTLEDIQNPCVVFSSVATEDVTCAFVLKETGLADDRIDLE